MGDVYGQYSTWICDDILFHSVPYLKSGDKSSLEYWAYDQLGQRVSMGCVRLTVADARWIYNNCPVGTQVEFYSSSNPGPLGKPSTKKISSAPSYVRGWDPTDPDSRNPWPKYLKELKEKEEEEKNENTVTNTVDKNEINTNTVNDIVDKNEINTNTINDTTGGNEINTNTINDIVDKNEINTNTTNETTNTNTAEDNKPSTNTNTAEESTNTTDSKASI